MSRAYQLMPDLAKFAQASEKGITLLRDYTTQNPNDQLASAYLGALLARQGKKELGETEMLRGASQVPATAEVAYRRAAFYAIANMPERAAALYNEASKSDFDVIEILDPDFNLVRDKPGFLSATKRAVDLSSIDP